MEEDIKIIKNHYVFTTSHVLDDENKRFKQAIENLINKNKEQEKIIKLMAESIADSGIFSDSYQSKIEADECCDTCEKCIKDYFKKKASEENG